MRIKALFGLLLVAGSYPAWRILLDAGLVPWSFDQWEAILWSAVSDPSRYWEAGLFALWALLLPLVGLVLVYEGLFAAYDAGLVDVHVPEPGSAARKNPLLDVRSEPEAAPSTRARGRAEPVLPEDEDADEMTRAAARAEARTRFRPDDPALGESQPSGFRGLVRRAVAMAGPAARSAFSAAHAGREKLLAARAGALAKAGARPAGKAASGRKPSLLAKLAARLPARRRPPPVVAPPPVGALRAPVHSAADRIMQWYAAWGPDGRQARPYRLAEEASELAAALTEEVTHELFELYSMHGLGALNTLKAAARRFDEGLFPSDATAPALTEKPRRATPMDRPSAEDLRDGAVAAEDDGLLPWERPAPPTEPQHDRTDAVSVRPNEDVARGQPDETDQAELGVETPAAPRPETLDDDAAAAPPYGTPAERSETSREGDSILGLRDEAFAAEDGTETAENAAVDEQEKDYPGILDIEDDIGVEPDQDILADDKALRLLGTVVRKDGTTLPIKAALAADSDRSSLTMDNAAMDAAIKAMAPERFKAILGSGRAGEPLPADAVDIGELAGLKNKSVFVAPLWRILDIAVQYQGRAFAWAQFGEEPPPELASPEQREAFLIKVGTTIATLRDQMPAATLEEICELKKGSEHVAWLRGRADMILRTLSTAEGRRKLQTLLGAPADERKSAAAPTAPAAPAVPSVETAAAPLEFIDHPYEAGLKLMAPTAQAYKARTVGSAFEFYRAIPIVTVPEASGDEPTYGVMDVGVGDLRRRIQDAGVAGVTMVMVRRGPWRLVAVSPEGPHADRFMLEGVRENVGKALRTRDGNLRIWDAWVRQKGMRPFSALHFVLEAGASFDGFADPHEAVAEMKKSLGRTEDVDFRLEAWSEAEWAALQEALAPPKA